MDTIDQRILHELEENAKCSYADLAKLLQISEPAVRKRVKKLEDKNVILGYRTLIDHKALGYSNKVVVGVDTTAADYACVIENLKKFPEVRNLRTSSGDHMLMFEVWVKDIEDLGKFIEKVNTIKGVVQSCPSVIHDNIK